MSRVKEARRLLAPCPFFSKRSGGWEPLLKRAKAAGRTVVFLDYDGTLVPIRPRPGDAVLSRSARALLVAVSRHPRISLHIVTGRSMADIRRLVGLKNVGYAACHGFEINLGQTSWQHPAAGEVRPLLRDVGRQLRRALADVEGTIVEDKGSTLSVHYRGMKGLRVDALKKIVSGIMQACGRLRVSSGKKVLEIWPDVTWDKGRATAKMLEMLALPASSPVVYIGDDRTDEDAFRALAPVASTILVGRGRTSRALYLFDDPDAVLSFLRRLLHALPQRD
jgi:trehalose-phosphatase